MTDALMTPEDREEALSYVYVSAIAAQAGYTTSLPSLDRDGVDLQIQAGGNMRPALDLQLKATVNLKKGRDGDVHYPLKIRNYELLRRETQTPRLLVVLHLPKEESCWVTVTPRKLVLRRCAYWLNLRRCKESQNKETITVRIPERNLFDVKTLIDLMEQSRQGSIQ